MASLRPSYMKKIALMNALAPVAFQYHTKTPPFFGLNKIWIFGSGAHNGEYLAHSNFFYKLCLSSDLAKSICLHIVLSSMGPDPDFMNMVILI